MNKLLINIPKLALALMASMPFIFSCDGKEETNLTPAIELTTNPVASAGGSQFVSVQATGSWTLSTASENGVSVDWLTLNPSSGVDSKSGVALKVSANTVESDRKAVITLETSYGRTSVTLTQKAASGGTTDPDNPDPVDPNPTDPDQPTTVSYGWLELPSVPADSKYDFFTHDMTIGSVKTRNYSFVWDYDNLVAPWVAYPLCKWNIGGSVKRTDNWQLDPLLPASKQPVLYKGFTAGNDGWKARGHQIPSADRLASAACNYATFYFTNMTPQIQNNFNGDIWANLENLVRSWANSSDTLYVVTGCVVDYKAGETVKYCLDNNGKKVTIPTAYYKAVLRYSKTSTYGHKDSNGARWMACAMWLDHKEYSNATVTSTYSLSIDELEQKTGFDFFANLPDAIGADLAATIESEKPSGISFWW